MSLSDKTCPFCGSSGILPVIYGYAPFDILVRADRGEVILGGACVEPSQPHWKCSACGRFIYPEEGDGE